jgi:LMBR1 domain-containing protein 1
VEPCKYFMYLVFGIVMGIICLIAIIQIFCYVAIVKTTGPTDQFLNKMLLLIEQSAVSFATIPIFILMGYYILMAAHRGNVKLGMRILFVQFYPIREKETFINSFFANCMMINLYSVAVTQFTIQCFSQYLLDT